METLEKDTITPVEWLTDDDVQKFDNEWPTHTTMGNFDDAD